MRQTYQLEPFEQRQFWKLRPVQGEALFFWGKIARNRGLDPTSLITDGRNGKFTGLPLNHDQHWCYPIPLRCSKKPVYKGI